VLKKKKKGCSGKELQKKGFKSGIKERVGDEKLIIINVAVRGINDHIRFYSQKRPFVRDYPGKPVPERQNQSGFY